MHVLCIVGLYACILYATNGQSTSDTLITKKGVRPLGSQAFNLVSVTLPLCLEGC